VHLFANYREEDFLETRIYPVASPCVKTGAEQS
jgi:hypothetical protein